jgi:hypothetical protein
VEPRPPETIRELYADAFFDGQYTPDSFAVNFTVAQRAPEPTISLTASPPSVEHDGTTTLSWSSADATACEGSGAWSDSWPLSGTETVGPLTAQSTFTLACSSDGGNQSESVVVAVVRPDSIPHASDDTAETTMGSAVTVNVLANDSNLEDTPIAMNVLAASSEGTASASDDSVTYTPLGSFAGTDAFSYRITDADGDLATATVVVHVTCPSCAAGKTLTLTWAPSRAEEQVRRYKVYFGATPETAKTEIADLSVSAGALDTNVPSADYDAWNELGLYLGDQACLRLNAYNEAGESAFSEAACLEL